MEYLDFELPLKELNEQLENCKKLGNEGKIDVKDTLKEIKLKIQLKKKEIYSSINAWQCRTNTYISGRVWASG